MSIVNFGLTGIGNPDDVEVPTGTGTRPLHRLGTVRRLQGVTRRTVARHLNIDVSQVKLQERETADMPLSQLYEWQKVLDVPVNELLVEAEDPLSAPVMKRAQLVRIMKTALAIMEEAKRPPIRRMAETMINQLVEIMPELKGVGPWHTVGKRRRRDDYGVAAERRLSDDLFIDRRD
ncbi:MAG: helix-turn-helix transcriptional regulator [Pirellulales bacterium]|nr:helix-turn-helix transcriptional regulator [Pirellulales bacterium]